MVQCVAEFIPWAATASAADANGITPLHLLCSNKNATVDIVRCLIEGNAEALRSQDKAGKTPLVYLCSNNELDERVSMDMLTLLLEMCPESAQCCTHDGHLPISYGVNIVLPSFAACSSMHIRILFSMKVDDRVALAVLKQLIDKNPDIDLCVRLIGMAFFHQAARENISRAAEIRSFLNQAWPELVVKFLSVFEHDENEVGYKPAVVDTSECTDCDLVRYCSDECQKEHESQHVEACKKRAAELRDELLFKQPESSHIGDCPICMLPLPLDKTKSTLHSCCSKVICNGCYFANYVRETKGSLQQRCPFCRKPASSTEEETGERRMKRVEANDPLAILTQGQVQLKKGDAPKAFEYMMKAAELGDAEAHFMLAQLYHGGHGVEKDEAAIGGHPEARTHLGLAEWDNENYERAVKHFIIAAKLGHDDSIKVLMESYKGGLVKKEVLDAALRAHQSAVDATKSSQREAAANEHWMFMK
eukprot:scaffold15294_cov101-Skeletonema_marinoi.AAC.2